MAKDTLLCLYRSAVGLRYTLQYNFQRSTLPWEAFKTFAKQRHRLVSSTPEPGKGWSGNGPHGSRGLTSKYELAERNRNPSLRSPTNSDSKAASSFGRSTSRTAACVLGSCSFPRQIACRM